MILAPLIVVCLCGWADDSDAPALVARLRSADQTVREEAAGNLEELGRPALPALYPLREAADADLRRTVERLIDLIERQRLLRATKVRLDFENQPLSAVVASLRSQTGFPVGIAEDLGLKTRRVTLHARQPVPFWPALDRVAAAGEARFIPRVAFSPEPRDPTILLVSAAGPPIPASDSGPFRLYLVGVSRSREIKAVRPPGQARLIESLQARLHFFAEPGLVVSPTGPAILEEVVDDQGQDRRAESDADPALNRDRPRFEAQSAGLFELILPLDPSASTGTKLRRLKGRVPITVMARAGDPVVVSLSGPAGEPVTKTGITVSVARIRTEEANTLFDLTIDASKRGQDVLPDLARGVEAIGQGDRIEDHIEIQDAQGRALWWNTTPSPHNAAGGRRELVVTVYSPPGGEPARLLYHNVVSATTEVSFEFQDVPLP